MQKSTSCVIIMIPNLDLPQRRHCVGYLHHIGERITLQEGVQSSHIDVELHCIYVYIQSSHIDDRLILHVIISVQSSHIRVTLHVGESYFVTSMKPAHLMKNKNQYLRRLKNFSFIHVLITSVMRDLAIRRRISACSNLNESKR